MTKHLSAPIETGWREIATSKDQHFGAFIMRVSTQGPHGGHIFSSAKGGSLCGIEKRRPHMDNEIEFEGEEFLPWLEVNQDWVCCTCLHIYKNLPPPPEPTHSN